MVYDDVIMNLKQKKSNKNNKNLNLDKIELQNTIQTSGNFRNFAELYFRSLNTCHFQTWQFY